MRLGNFNSSLAIALTAFAADARGAPPAPAPPELVLQVPPGAAVNSVAVSPDGALVASAGEGGVRLYDAKTGELLRAIGEAGDRSVAFSPDGRRVAAGGFHMDKLIGVYDVQTGRRVQALEGIAEWEVDACAISPDGKLLAASCVDRQILVWDLATGALRHRLAGQPTRTPALAFSPDGATLAAGGGVTIRLWDVEAGRVRRSLDGHRGWICTLAFSPDGATLAAGGCDWGFHRGHDWPRPEGSGPEQGEWRLWDVATGQPRHAATGPGRFLSLAFAPDGKSLACGLGADVRIYDFSSEAPARVATAHHFGVTSVAFSPDGTSIISGSHDQTVRRTGLATGQTEWEAPGSFEWVNSVAASADGSLLATGGSDGRFALGRRKAGAGGIGSGAARLWDARSGRLLRRLGDPADQIMAVALSPDGCYLVAGGGGPGGNGVVSLWNAATGAPAWSARDHAEEVLAVAFAPDGSSLASGSADGKVSLRDARTGSVARNLAGHIRGATAVAFTPDGKALACAAGDGTTIRWDVSEGKQIRTFRPAHSQAGTIRWDRPMTSLAISRDGKTIVTCTSAVNQIFAEPARIWDVETGKLKREFPDVRGRPMALSPDGAILATGGKAVQLWDVRTGKPIRKLYGHLKRTQSIAFSADGRFVFSGGSYGTTNAWEVASGRHLVTLFAFPEKPGGTTKEEWLAYHPDGYYDGSPGVDRLLAWRVGDELLTPKSPGMQLRRPERVESALKLQPEGSGSP